MTSSIRTSTGTRSRCRAVRKHIANALVGQTVDLLVDADTIVHGVVTGVLNEAGAPKLVVDGTGYDLNQILTAMPACVAEALDGTTLSDTSARRRPAALDQQLQTRH